jgi:hypothetical protein
VNYKGGRGRMKDENGTARGKKKRNSPCLRVSVVIRFSFVIFLGLDGYVRILGHE